MARWLLEDQAGQGAGWWTRQGSGWQSGWSHIRMWISWEEQLGSKTDHTSQDPVQGNKASELLALEIYGG